MSKFLTTPRILEKLLLWETIFPGSERVPLSARRERGVRSHGIELIRITRIERFPDDRPCSRGSAVMNSTTVTGGTLRSGWKNDERSERKREGTGRWHISCHRLSGNEFFISR